MLLSARTGSLASGRAATRKGCPSPARLCTARVAAQPKPIIPGECACVAVGVCGTSTWMGAGRAGTCRRSQTSLTAGVCRAGPGQQLSTPSLCTPSQHHHHALWLLTHTRTHTQTHAHNNTRKHTGPQEERESAHEAFMHALESAKPVKLRMPGLQEFAAAVRFIVGCIPTRRQMPAPPP